VWQLAPKSRAPGNLSPAALHAVSHSTACDGSGLQLWQEMRSIILRAGNKAPSLVQGRNFAKCGEFCRSYSRLIRSLNKIAPVCEPTHANFHTLGYTSNECSAQSMSEGHRSEYLVHMVDHLDVWANRLDRTCGKRRFDPCLLHSERCILFLLSAAPLLQCDHRTYDMQFVLTSPQLRQPSSLSFQYLRGLISSMFTATPC
jgi:hypothetical protein